ncbi:unnamed protein product, partial [marine sediment metagenome]
IMAMSGHRTERDFLTYLRATNKDHARIIAEHWETA